MPHLVTSHQSFVPSAPLPVISTFLLLILGYHGRRDCDTDKNMQEKGKAGDGREKLTGLCWLVYVYSTQTRLTREEGISIELLLPSAWPGGRTVGYFLGLWLMRKHHPTADVLALSGW